MLGRPRKFDESEALDAAMRLFWERGYEACSVGMLMKAMKLNRQSAYNAFGDKQELFKSALEHYAAQVGGEMKGFFGDETLSPLTRVRLFIRAIEARSTSSRHLGCLMTNTLAESSEQDREIRRFIRSVLEQLEEILTTLLSQAIKRKELKTRKQSRQLARFLISVMQGSLVLAKAEMTPVIRDSLAVAESFFADE